MNETRKPIGESDLGANDGVSVAIHHVTVWIENDSKFAETAKDVARMANLDGLREYVARCLYQDDSAYPADVLHTIKNVRDSFTREDFDGIDWAEVRESLLAE